jgi:hypothetical protein
MNQSNRTNRRLSLFFTAWIVLANGLLLLSSSTTVIDHWLGAGFLWALLIPLACLVWLNPRRSWGLVLGTAGIGILVVLRISRQLLPRRSSMTGVSLH